MYDLLFEVKNWSLNLDNGNAEKITLVSMIIIQLNILTMCNIQRNYGLTS
jgi:hypothetical protein